uniref:peptidylprolyl isomerase n=1 Tax=Roseovarius sp. BRH_c41 TaxID=1629709 RepID=UPI000AADAB47|nr:peptidylprolyl isomerase [Roseovarius sp. BRH_c41]
MVKGLLREPLVGFFLFGAAIFGLYAVFDDTPPAVSESVLIVTETDARRLAAEFEAVWRRPPTVEELDHMIGQYVREEVYVREALSLGLDRDDAVIRTRLQTKMEFLTETGAEGVEPDDATLQAHLDAHPDRFAEPPLVAFEQLLLDDRIGSDEIVRVEARLNRGADPDEVARPTVLPPAFRLSRVQVVDGTFGTGFFDAVAEMPAGAWAGPVETSLGRHLVRVTERRAARLPPLSEIRGRVEQDWRAAFTQALREERYQALLSRYDLVRPDASTVLAP